MNGKDEDRAEKLLDIILEKITVKIFKEYKRYWEHSGDLSSGDNEELPTLHILLQYLTEET